MDWIFVSPGNPYIDALTPSVDVFGDGASKEATRIEWNPKDEALIQKD